MAELNEAVAEVAESVAEEALNVADVSRSLSGRDLSIGLVVGASVGSSITFLVVRRWLEDKYERFVETEIDAMRDHFRAKLSETMAAKANEDKPDLEQIVRERGYVPPPPGDVNVIPPGAIPGGFEGAKEELYRRDEQRQQDMANVFESDWDYEQELASRNPDRPYVIHREEFKEGEFIGVSLTYYEGDDILCDDQNKLIDNKDSLVGEDNLSKFGHGSGNSHIVYIRNESLSIDIELVKREGTFAEEVHGLKHSDRPRRARFNDFDEN